MATIFILFALPIVIVCIIIQSIIDKRKKKQAEEAQWQAAEAARLQIIEAQRQREEERRAAEIADERRRQEIRAELEERSVNAQCDTLQKILRRKIIFDRMTAAPVTLAPADTFAKSSFPSGIFPQMTKLIRTSSYRVADDYVAIDTETTGLRYHVNDIVQLAAVRFRHGRATDYFLTYLKPRNGINAKAQAINGIGEEQVADAPCIEQVAASFFAFVGKDNVIGHNLLFDLRFLEASGIVFTGSSRRFYDTLELARQAYPDALTGYKLDALTEPLGIYHDSKHDALADAFAAGYLYAECFAEITGHGNTHYDNADIDIPAAEWDYFREREISIPDRLKQQYGLD